MAINCHYMIVQTGMNCQVVDRWSCVKPWMNIWTRKSLGHWEQLMLKLILFFGGKDIQMFSRKLIIFINNQIIYNFMLLFDLFSNKLYKFYKIKFSFCMIMCWMWLLFAPLCQFATTSSEMVWDKWILTSKTPTRKNFCSRHWILSNT